MVECECRFEPFLCKHNIVLIDTWWNVNNSERVFLFVPASVLIDTWWNVNEKEAKHFSGSIGFNRYMVECESVHLLTEAKAKGSFNRYMVECELMCIPLR